LIAQLDENRFARRAEAFRELQQLGSSIEPLLREPAESHASGEVRARLRQLLESWAAMTPQNGYETTWVRALDVLARIGSEAAKELTTRVSGAEQFPSVVRKHAQDGLANWQSPEVE
jgi:hypothetical protein